MIKKYTVAVIGATGHVGREVLNTLASREFPIKNIFAAASSNSVGKGVSFKEDTLTVQEITKLNFNDIDLAFFCTDSKISKQYVEHAIKSGCIVIDKSSHYRLNSDVPLIVPEVNIGLLDDFKSGIIANPNCCVIPLAVVLTPLDNVAKIKRVVISTYQSVSGAGKEAMDELYNQTKAKFIFEQLTPKVLPEQIAFNLFPQIGEFIDDGRSTEEYKITEELKKIIGDHVESTVTCVRVPTFISHAMSVNIEFEKDINAQEVEEILSEESAIITYNPQNHIKYGTPIDTVGQDEIFVSRIRNDNSRKNTINLWICSDNLKKGAALNAVQIAENLLG